MGREKFFIPFQENQDAFDITRVRRTRAVLNSIQRAFHVEGSYVLSGVAFVICILNLLVFYKENLPMSSITMTKRHTIAQYLDRIVTPFSARYDRFNGISGRLRRNHALYRRYRIFSVKRLRSYRCHSVLLRRYECYVKLQH